MAEYRVYGVIEATDDPEMLSDLTWLKDNYGSKIGKADALSSGASKRTSFSLTEPTFDDAVTTLNALTTQFSGRINSYGFQFTG